MVLIDYTSKTSVTDYSKSIRLLTYTIFQAHVTYVTLIIALNIQVDVSNKPCLYLFACWHNFMNFFNKVYLF